MGQLKQVNNLLPLNGVVSCSPLCAAVLCRCWAGEPAGETTCLEQKLWWFFCGRWNCPV